VSLRTLLLVNPPSETLVAKVLRDRSVSFATTRLELGHGKMSDCHGLRDAGGTVTDI
jgi:hypothetical protein